MAYQVTSALPGSVWKILVEVGQQVEEDQSVVIVESMKMENDMFTDQAGTVKAILVEQGQAVQAVQPLVEIE